MSAAPDTEGRWPDFLVIGAGRAGTTSLHRYLSRHPDVFLPATKAPSYWYATARQARTDLPSSFVRSRQAYRSLFRDARPGQRCGDVSPVYLAAMDVPPRVIDDAPSVRVVALLRHPVDRVYARWVARRRDGLEPTRTFEELVARELREPVFREDAHATYLASGIVAPVLARWFELVPPDRRLVLWYEDFARDTAACMREVCRFLGVRDDVDLGTARSHNASGGRIRHPVVRSLWAASFPVRQAVRPLIPAAWRDAAFRTVTRDVVRMPLAADTRARLTEAYTPEIHALEALTGRDLSTWLATTDPRRGRPA